MAILRTPLALIFLLTLLPPSVLAEARVLADPAGANRQDAIEIYGLITANDTATVSTLVSRLLEKRKSESKTLNEFDGAGLNIYLNSQGGDLLAAIEIGRTLRKANVFTIVFGECSSACLFILASGVVRYATSNRLGLHRPRFDQTKFAKLNPSEARELYNRMIERCRDYLREMGVSEQLLYDMLQVPSQDILYKDFRYAEIVHLSGEDPAFVEWRRAKELEVFGAAKVRERDHLLLCTDVTKDISNVTCTPGAMKIRKFVQDEMKRSGQTPDPNDLVPADQPAPLPSPDDLTPASNQ